MNTLRTLFVIALIAASSCGGGPQSGAASKLQGLMDVSAATEARMGTPRLPVMQGGYEVCHVGDYEHAPTTELAGPHITLHVGDRIKIGKIDLVTDVMFQRNSDKLIVPMIACCGAKTLAAIEWFDHSTSANPKYVKAGHLVTIVDETPTDPNATPKGCKLDEKNNRLITIRFCFPKMDDKRKGELIWACPGSRLPHLGDKHATGPAK